MASMAVSVVPWPVMKMIRLLGFEPAEVVEDLQARAVAQANIQQDYVGRTRRRPIADLRRQSRPRESDTVVCENLLDAETNARLVVNYQEFCHGGLLSRTE